MVPGIYGEVQFPWTSDGTTVKYQTNLLKMHCEVPKKFTKFFTETLQIATISNRYWIDIVATSNPYRNDFDVESTSKRGCYDKDSTLASTSYQYHYDIVTTLSFRYGFDVATISIRCRNRYHFDVEYISKW